ncbi:MULTISPECIES: CsgG/HfaB family protein [Flavobacteriaceae]|uniref:CsgG/HfaB family protein n=1 Tax=Flavobacteriaceae TaxID=49546 RepID=UPI00149169E0|nr:MULTISPECIES: CsgG/HfaB family protein [Allomuricauda]MDC6366668.1 CsgG/HfaB family protein [Muricauda sp. AC10]
MKMKKYLFVILLASSWIYGQESTIGLQSITSYNPTKDYVEAELIFQKIKEILVNSRNFEVLDRESLGIVLTEQEIQKQITSINAKVVDQGKIAGAQYIIGGKLIGLEYKKAINLLQKSKVAGQTLQRAVFSFSVDILDTESSKTLETKTFKVGTLNTKSIGGLTKIEAFQAALKALTKDLEKFLNKFIAKSVAIVSIEEEKGGAAKKILLNTGEANGAKKNDKLGIYELSTVTIGNKQTQREKWVADVKIEAIEGEELSTAMVVKGGKELLDKFNSQKTLICKSK